MRGQSLLPPGIACVIDSGQDRQVLTYEDVRRNRQAWHAQRLASLREAGDLWLPVRLWVAYFNQSLMGGWHAFLDNSRGRIWIDRDSKLDVATLMALYPLLLPFGSESERWAAWKPEFARRFRRRTQDGEPVGVAMLWQLGRELALRPTRVTP